jgi:hypothetical protein
MFCLGGVICVVRTKEEYLAEEARESDIVRADEEWDCDETCFKDGDITLDDLKNSPIYKVTYGRYIGQSNWVRWIL